MLVQFASATLLITIFQIKPGDGVDRVDVFVINVIETALKREFATVKAVD